MSAGARREVAAREVGLDPRTVERWRGGKADDERRGPRTTPRNKLPEATRAKVLKAATSPAFRDLSPKQIVPLLADRGVYLASESTMYRLLRAEALLAHRGRTAVPTPRERPEHVATGPRQVWSWDITYLRSDVRGAFYYLYVVLDVWSRKVVGWRIEDAECTELASAMVETAVQMEGSRPHVLHADNGGPMKGATLKATLERLGILASYSRPRVSDDNPFSEAHFRTVKCGSRYPTKPFASLDEARAWGAAFVRWYNTEHLHSGIGFVTPIDRHEMRHIGRLARRRQVYRAARALHPERWSGAIRAWDSPPVVTLNAKKGPHAASLAAA